MWTFTVIKLLNFQSSSICIVCASPAWLARLWSGVMSATTAVSWTARVWPLPAWRGLRPWPRKTKFWFLLARRPCLCSHGAVGVRSTSWSRKSVVRPLVGALVTRSPTQNIGDGSIGNKKCTIHMIIKYWNLHYSAYFSLKRIKDSAILHTYTKKCTAFILITSVKYLSF